MSQPPEAPRSGMLGDALGRLLSYADRPWKAVVIVVLVVLGGVGWALYEKRDELLEAWLTPSTTVLLTAEVPAALEKLASEADADIVQIWAVDLGSNSQWFVGARRRDGERPVIPVPRRLPVIVHASDIKAVIDVLEGNPTCRDLTLSGSPLARRLAERGMKRGCAVPIPPNPETFVGVIYLGWATAPDASAENVAVGAAREIAKKLGSH